MSARKFSGAKYERKETQEIWGSNQRKGFTKYFDGYVCVCVSLLRREKDRDGWHASHAVLHQVHKRTFTDRRQSVVVSLVKIERREQMSKRKDRKPEHGEREKRRGRMREMKILLQMLDEMCSSHLERRVERCCFILCEGTERKEAGGKDAPFHPVNKIWRKSKFPLPRHDATEDGDGKRRCSLSPSLLHQERKMLLL